MHLADAFIQSDLQCIQAIHLYCQCALCGMYDATFIRYAFIIIQSIGTKTFENLQQQEAISYGEIGAFCFLFSLKEILENTSDFTMKKLASFMNTE